MTIFLLYLVTVFASAVECLQKLSKNDRKHVSIKVNGKFQFA